MVPNGVLLDEDGTIRWAKFGGFSIDNPDDVAVVERFLAGEEPGPTPVQDAPYALGPLERELVMTKLQLGRVLLDGGRIEEAVAAWRDARDHVRPVLDHLGDVKRSLASGNPLDE